MSAFISLLSNGTLRVFILAENCRETFLLINYKSDYNFGKIFGTLHFHMHFCSCGSAFNAHHLWMHTYCNSSQTSSPVTQLTCFWGRTEHFRWKVTSLHPNECEWWGSEERLTCRWGWWRWMRSAGSRKAHSLRRRLDQSECGCSGSLTGRSPDWCLHPSPPETTRDFLRASSSAEQNLEDHGRNTCSFVWLLRSVFQSPQKEWNGFDG